MIIYTDAALRSYGTLKEVATVLPLKTMGYTVTNISNVNMIISTDKLGTVTTLLPYFSQTLPGNVGDTITIVPGELSTGAIQVETMSVAIDFSQVPITPALVPLANLPAYVVNASITNAVIPVSGNVNATIQNASIPVTGGVSATITNADIPVSGNVNANVTNASIAVTGGVNVTNASIPVTGNVNATIQNASIPITGNVGITSGTVNATIQNASLNSNVTNAMLNTNPLVIIGTKTFTKSFAGSEVYIVAIDMLNDLTHTSPLGVFNEGWIVVTSVNGNLDNFSFQPYQENLIRLNTIAAFFPASLCSFTTGKTLYTRVSNPFVMPEIPFDQVTFSMVNNGTGAIGTDTYTLTFYAKSSTKTVENTIVNPVLTQGIQQNMVTFNTADKASAQTLTIVGSGISTYLHKIVYTVDNTLAATSGVMYYNGAFLMSIAFPQVSVTAPTEIEFGTGIRNYGISIYLPPHCRIHGMAIISVY